MKTFKPVYPKDLRGDEKMKFLGYIMFPNEKRDVRIKGHHCADGQNQQDKPYHKDIMLPTVSTEAVFVMSVNEEF